MGTNVTKNIHNYTENNAVCGHLSEPMAVTVPAH